MSTDLDASSDSFADIEPVISNSRVPSIPTALFRMKRQPDQVQAGGKRKRVYQDSNGNPVVVDEEFFTAMNSIDQALTHLNHPNFQSIEEGGSNDDDGFNPFDDEETSRRDEQVRFERGMKAARITERAVQQRRVTPGVRKIRQTMQSQNLTNEDLVETLDNDDECLRWAPVVNPETSLVHNVLKANTNLDSCYGCSRGIGVTRVTHDKLQDLRQMIVDLFPTTHITVVCILVSEWFETEIKEQFNRKPVKGMALLESWSPASIYEHITYHMTEASFIHNKLLRDMIQHYRVVLYREVYRVPAEYARPGNRIKLSQMRVAKRGHDMLIQSAKMVLEILSKKPETMSNYNPKFNIAQEYTGPLNLKAGTSTISKNVSIFDDIDTGV